MKRSDKFVLTPESVSRQTNEIMDSMISEEDFKLTPSRKRQGLTDISIQSQYR